MLFFDVFEGVELFVCALSVFIGGVNIAGGCLKRFVAEKYLYCSRIRAFFGKIGGEAVTKRVSGGRDDDTEEILITFYLHLEIIRRDTDFGLAAVFPTVGNKKRWIIIITCE